MKTLAGFFVGMVGLALAVGSDGAIAATECNGVLSGTVVGGVVINAGDICFLGGANVSGGVQVNSGGILIACASTINGGVVADGGTARTRPEWGRHLRRGLEATIARAQLITPLRSKAEAWPNP